MKTKIYGILCVGLVLFLYCVVGSIITNTDGALAIGIAVLIIVAILAIGSHLGEKYKYEN